MTAASTRRYIKAAQTPAIGLLKTASIPSFSAAGTVVTYSYVVTNGGNATLTSITRDRPHARPVRGHLPDQRRVSSGRSRRPAPPPTPPPRPTSTPAPSPTRHRIRHPPVERRHHLYAILGDHSRQPASSRSPSSSRPTSPASRRPGTHVTYSYLVTNTGNVILNPIAVTDPMAGLSAVTCSPAAPWLPGASETCTATYTTTQADVDRGNITNTGTAPGTPPTGSPVTASSSLNIPAVQTAGIALVKTANVSSFSTTGRLVTYSYRVTNTGNVTLNPVAVTDPMTGLSAINCPAHHPGSRGLRHLHRHLHHHPGRRGRRRHHQHRHRDRHTTRAERPSTARRR